MSGKIQKLRQELTYLEEKTEILSVQIREKYTAYLDVLGQSVYKQLFLAVYQICTQTYPQEFLALPYSQRQKLQENIKAIAKMTQTNLLKLQETGYPKIETLKIDVSMPQFMAYPNNQETAFLPSPFSLNFQEDKLEKTNYPEVLFNWCKTLEQAIVETLNHLSKETNHHLQQAYILPSKLPTQVLDMAIQAEEAGQSTTGNANLLNVIIETETKNSNKSQEETEESSLNPKTTQITAIHLRLVEIEFSDPTLNLERNQIRSLLEQVKQIHKQYYKKQKEHAVAEAESAWRSSWYED